MNRFAMAAFITAMACTWAHGAFTITEEGGKLIVSDGDAPVYVYNFEPVSPPEGVDAKFTRSSYIHPLYGLNGEVITQDFPDDHYHHRGIFWGWPQTKVGDRVMDIWAVEGARPRFERWLMRDAGEDKATIGVENTWRFDDDPWPKVRVQMYVTAHATESNARAMDFLLRFQNISNEAFTIAGQDVIDGKQEVVKGYGGFNIRPDKANAPFTFYGKDGLIEEDVLWLDTPWTAIAWAGEKPAGMAIFEHPTNPDYPHGGWILRHYGFIGQSWPHAKAFAIEPADYVELRYRVLVFAGTADEAGLADRFKAYTEAPPRFP